MANAKRQQLFDLVVGVTKPVEWETEFVKRHIARATYEDVINDERLSGFITEREEATQNEINLERLSGVAPNQLRVSSLDEVQDAIGLILRLAEMNMELALGSLFGNADVGISEGADIVIATKVARAVASASLVDQFSSLLQLSSVPDAGQGVAIGAIPLSVLWKVRQGKHAVAFRNWLRNADTSDANGLARAYLAALQQHGLEKSLTVRTIRFALVIAASAVDPGLGIASSVVDTFFVDNWLKGYSPKLFLDRLRRLPG